MNAGVLQQVPCESSGTSTTTVYSQQQVASSVSDMFFSKFTPTRTSSSEVAMKRKKLNLSAAVITSEEYLDAINSINANSKSRHAPKRPTTPPHSPTNYNKEDSDDDLQRLPPPLPKLLSTTPTRKRRWSSAATVIHGERASMRLSLRNSANPRFASKCIAGLTASTSGTKLLPTKPLVPKSKSCLYCNDSSSRGREKWTQCRKCFTWAHSACAGISPSFVDFECELCV